MPTESEMRAERLQLLIDHLAENPRFATWPGSTGKHHFYDGGLLQHTREVATIASRMAETVMNLGSEPIDDELVAVSCLLHDWGKTQVYMRDDTGTWGKDPSHQHHHIEYSIEKVQQLLPKLGYSTDFIERVVACIQTHHGDQLKDQFGEPQSPEAWIVHLADVVSAMVVGRNREP